jgi:hypothetical protein
LKPPEKLMMDPTPKFRVAKLPWWTALLTVTTIALAFVFHSRWIRPVTQWPINLPMRPYTFVDHPGLRDFDSAAAGDQWESMVHHNWWDTEWRDDAGHRFPRGIDVFHKMHCLVAIRTEFSMLATDPTRAAKLVFSRDDKEERAEPSLNVNARHLQHCFDFLRQVHF